MSVLSHIGFSAGTISLFAVFGFVNPVHAAIINGDFSDGLNNWDISLNNDSDPDPDPEPTATPEPTTILAMIASFSLSSRVLKNKK